MKMPADRAAAQKEYELAQARFLHAMTGEGARAIIETAAGERLRLHAELKDLTALAQSRHEDAIAAARAYATLLPHRVRKAGIEPPSTFEKIGSTYGSERSYKLAASALDAYTEVRELLAKRRRELVALEDGLRKTLDKREAVLKRQLESPESLRSALQRDPLLNRAYQRLRAFDQTPEQLTYHA
jgi:hypothetical protein